MLGGCRRKNFLGVVVVCLWDLIHLTNGEQRRSSEGRVDLVLSNGDIKKMTIKKRRMKTMKMTIQKMTIKMTTTKEDDDK